MKTSHFDFNNTRTRLLRKNRAEMVIDWWAVKLLPNWTGVRLIPADGTCTLFSLGVVHMASGASLAFLRNSWVLTIDVFWHRGLVPGARRVLLLRAWEA
ncbi:MAG: hypothetical protein N3G20_12095 [Verrucomicrobiae bacterium]|nr:hypothetical protein [Verrucomicrobiae bacterium]